MSKSTILSPNSTAGSPELNMEDQTIKALEKEVKDTGHALENAQIAYKDEQEKLAEIKNNAKAYEALQKEIATLEADKKKKQERLQAIEKQLSPSSAEISEEDQAKLDALNKDIAKASGMLKRKNLKDETKTKWEAQLADLKQQQQNLQNSLAAAQPTQLKPRQEKKLRAEKSVLETQINLEDQELKTKNKNAAQLIDAGSFADQITAQQSSILSAQEKINETKENHKTAKEKFDFFKRKIHGLGTVIGAAAPGLITGALFKLACTTALTPLGLGVPAVAGFAWGVGYNLYKNKGSEQKGKWKQALTAGAIGAATATGIPIAGELLGFFGDACSPLIDNAFSALDNSSDLTDAAAQPVESAAPEAVVETTAPESVIEITIPEESVTETAAEDTSSTYEKLRASGAIPASMTEADLCLSEESGGVSMLPTDSVIAESTTDGADLPPLTTETTVETTSDEPVIATGVDEGLASAAEATDLAATAEVTVEQAEVIQNGAELPIITPGADTYIIPGSELDTLLDAENVANADTAPNETPTISTGVDAGLAKAAEAAAFDAAKAIDIVDASALLDSVASNDMELVQQFITAANDIGGVNADLITAVEAKMVDADFVMSADAVKAVTEYANALTASLDDGTLTNSEYRSALSTIFEKLADPETNFVKDIAGQLDDTEWYNRSTQPAALNGMEHAMKLAA
jgi:hypothetical protein